MKNKVKSGHGSLILTVICYTLLLGAALCVDDDNSIHKEQDHEPVKLHNDLFHPDEIIPEQASGDVSEEMTPSSEFLQYLKSQTQQSDEEGDDPADVELEDQDLLEVPRPKVEPQEAEFTGSVEKENEPLEDGSLADYSDQGSDAVLVEDVDIPPPVEEPKKQSIENTVEDESPSSTPTAQSSKLPVATEGGLLQIPSSTNSKRSPKSGSKWTKGNQILGAQKMREAMKRHLDQAEELTDASEEDPLFEWKKTRLFPSCKKWVLVDGVRYCGGKTSTGILDDADAFTEQYKNIHPKHRKHAKDTYRDEEHEHIRYENEDKMTRSKEDRVRTRMKFDKVTYTRHEELKLDKNPHAKQIPHKRIFREDKIGAQIKPIPNDHPAQPIETELLEKEEGQMKVQPFEDIEEHQHHKKLWTKRGNKRPIIPMEAVHDEEFDSLLQQQASEARRHRIGLPSLLGGKMKVAVTGPKMTFGTFEGEITIKEEKEDGGKYLAMGSGKAFGFDATMLMLKSDTNYAIALELTGGPSLASLPGFVGGEVTGVPGFASIATLCYSNANYDSLKGVEAAFSSTMLTASENLQVAMKMALPGVVFPRAGLSGTFGGSVLTPLNDLSLYSRYKLKDGLDRKWKGPESLLQTSRSVFSGGDASRGGDLSKGGESGCRSMDAPNCGGDLISSSKYQCECARSPACYWDLNAGVYNMGGNCFSTSCLTFKCPTKADYEAKLKSDGMCDAALSGNDCDPTCQTKSDWSDAGCALTSTDEWEDEANYVERSDPQNYVMAYGYANNEGKFEIHFDATGKVSLAENSVATMWSNIVNIKFTNHNVAAEYNKAVTSSLSFEAEGFAWLPTRIMGENAQNRPTLEEAGLKIGDKCNEVDVLGIKQETKTVCCGQALGQWAEGDTDPITGWCKVDKGEELLQETASSCQAQFHSWVDEMERKYRTKKESADSICSAAAPKLTPLSSSTIEDQVESHTEGEFELQSPSKNLNLRDVSPPTPTTSFTQGITGVGAGKENYYMESDGNGNMVQCRECPTKSDYEEMLSGGGTCDGGFTKDIAFVATLTQAELAVCIARCQRQFAYRQAAADGMTCVNYISSTAENTDTSLGPWRMAIEGTWNYKTNGDLSIKAVPKVPLSISLWGGTRPSSCVTIGDRTQCQLRSSACEWAADQKTGTSGCIMKKKGAVSTQKIVIRAYQPKDGAVSKDDCTPTEVMPTQQFAKSTSACGLKVAAAFESDVILVSKMPLLKHISILDGGAMIQDFKMLVINYNAVGANEFDQNRLLTTKNFQAGINIAGRVTNKGGGYRNNAELTATMDTLFGVQANEIPLTAWMALSATDPGSRTPADKRECTPGKWTKSHSSCRDYKIGFSLCGGVDIVMAGLMKLSLLDPEVTFWRDGGVTHYQSGSHGVFRFWQAVGSFGSSDDTNALTGDADKLYKVNTYFGKCEGANQHSCKKMDQCNWSSDSCVTKPGADFSGSPIFTVHDDALQLAWTKRRGAGVPNKDYIIRFGFDPDDPPPLIGGGAGSEVAHVEKSMPLNAAVPQFADKTTLGGSDGKGTSRSGWNGMSSTEVARADWAKWTTTSFEAKEEFTALEAVMKHTGRTKGTEYKLSDLYQRWKDHGKKHGLGRNNKECRYSTLCRSKKKPSPMNAPRKAAPPTWGTEFVQEALKQQSKKTDCERAGCKWEGAECSSMAKNPTADAAAKCTALHEPSSNKACAWSPTGSCVGSDKAPAVELVTQRKLLSKTSGYGDPITRRRRSKEGDYCTVYTTDLKSTPAYCCDKPTETVVAGKQLPTSVECAPPQLTAGEDCDYTSDIVKSHCCDGKTKKVRKGSSIKKPDNRKCGTPESSRCYGKKECDACTSSLVCVQTYEDTVRCKKPTGKCAVKAGDKCSLSDDLPQKYCCDNRNGNKVAEGDRKSSSDIRCDHSVDSGDCNQSTELKDGYCCARVDKKVVPGKTSNSQSTSCEFKVGQKCTKSLHVTARAFCCDHSNMRIASGPQFQYMKRNRCILGTDCTSASDITPGYCCAPFSKTVIAGDRIDAQDAMCQPKIGDACSATSGGNRGLKAANMCCSRKSPHKVMKGSVTSATDNTCELELNDECNGSTEMKSSWCCEDTVVKDGPQLNPGTNNKCGVGTSCVAGDEMNTKLCCSRAKPNLIKEGKQTGNNDAMCELKTGDPCDKTTEMKSSWCCGDGNVKTGTPLNYPTVNECGIGMTCGAGTVMGNSLCCFTDTMKVRNGEKINAQDAMCKPQQGDSCTKSTKLTGNLCCDEGDKTIRKGERNMLNNYCNMEAHEGKCTENTNMGDDKCCDYDEKMIREGKVAKSGSNSGFCEAEEGKCTKELKLAQGKCCDEDTIRDGDAASDSFSNGGFCEASAGTKNCNKDLGVEKGLCCDSDSKVVVSGTRVTSGVDEGFCAKEEGSCEQGEELGAGKCCREGTNEIESGTPAATGTSNAGWCAATTGKCDRSLGTEDSYCCDQSLKKVRKGQVSAGTGMCSIDEDGDSDEAGQPCDGNTHLSDGFCCDEDARTTRAGTPGTFSFYCALDVGDECSQSDKLSKSLCCHEDSKTVKKGGRAGDSTMCSLEVGDTCSAKDELDGKLCCRDDKVQSGKQEDSLSNECKAAVGDECSSSTDLPTHLCCGKDTKKVRKDSPISSTNNQCISVDIGDSCHSNSALPRGLCCANSKVSTGKQQSWTDVTCQKELGDKCKNSDKLINAYCCDGGEVAKGKAKDDGSCAPALGDQCTGDDKDADGAYCCDLKSKKLKQAKRETGGKTWCAKGIGDDCARGEDLPSKKLCCNGRKKIMSGQQVDPKDNTCVLGKKCNPALENKGQNRLSLGMCCDKEEKITRRGRKEDEEVDNPKGKNFPPVRRTLLECEDTVAKLKGFAETIYEATKLTSVAFVVTNIDLCSDALGFKKTGSEEAGFCKVDNKKIGFGKYANIVLSSQEEELQENDDDSSNTNTHWLDSVFTEHGFKVLPSGISFWFDVVFGQTTLGDLKDDTMKAGFANNKWTGVIALEMGEDFSVADPSNVKLTIEMRIIGGKLWMPENESGRHCFQHFYVRLELGINPFKLDFTILGYWSFAPKLDDGSGIGPLSNFGPAMMNIGVGKRTNAHDSGFWFTLAANFENVDFSAMGADKKIVLTQVVVFLDFDSGVNDDTETPPTDKFRFGLHLDVPLSTIMALLSTENGKDFTSITNGDTSSKLILALAQFTQDRKSDTMLVEVGDKEFEFDVCGFKVEFHLAFQTMLQSCAIPFMQSPYQQGMTAMLAFKVWFGPNRGAVNSFGIQFDVKVYNIGVISGEGVGYVTDKDGDTVYGPYETIGDMKNDPAINWDKSSDDNYAKCRKGSAKDKEGEKLDNTDTKDCDRKKYLKQQWYRNYTYVEEGLRADEFGFSIILGRAEKKIVAWGGLSWKVEDYNYKQPGMFMLTTPAAKQYEGKLEWNDDDRHWQCVEGTEGCENVSYKKDYKGKNVREYKGVKYNGMNSLEYETKMCDPLCATLKNCHSQSEGVKSWQSFMADLGYDIQFQTFTVAVFMTTWWDGPNQKRSFSFGEVWILITLGPVCAPTFFVCEFGAGMGVKFIKDAWPDPPTDADMGDNAVEINANFFVSIIKVTFMFDLRISNLGFATLGNVFDAGEGFKKAAAYLPTFEEFNVMVAIGPGGEIGRCPAVFPVCIPYEPGFAIDFRLVWWILVVEFQFSIIFNPMPKPGIEDLSMGLKFQMADLITSIFKLLFDTCKFSEETMEKMKAVLDFLGSIGLMPLLEIAVFEIEEFSVTKFAKGEEEFTMNLDATVFGFNFGFSISLGSDSANDVGSPKGGDEEEMAMIQETIEKKHVANAICSDKDDLSYHPPGCTKEHMLVQTGSVGMLVGFMIKMTIEIARKLLKWLTKLLNMGLGLFGMRLVCELTKVDGVATYTTITLEAYKSIFEALLDAIIIPIVNTFKRIANMVLRPLSSLLKVSLMFGITECVPKALTNQQMGWGYSLLLTDEQKELEGECENAVYDDRVLCKYDDNDENNRLPLFKRTIMNQTMCVGRPKCIWSDGKCQEKDKAGKCAANPKCQMRDSEDFLNDIVETENYEMVQTTYAKEIAYHLQAASNPPDIAFMHPLQLMAFFRKRAPPKMGPELYDDESEAALVLMHIGHEFNMGCKSAKRLIRKKGLKRFKELTGLRLPPRCTMSRKQRLKYKRTGVRPMSLTDKEYDAMYDYMVSRTHRRLAPEIEKYKKELEEERKKPVMEMLQASTRLENARIDKEAKESENQEAQVAEHLKSHEEIEMEKTKAKMFAAFKASIMKHEATANGNESDGDLELMQAKLNKPCLDAAIRSIKHRNWQHEANRVCRGAKGLARNIKEIIDDHHKRLQDRTKTTLDYITQQTRHRKKCRYDFKYGPDTVHGASKDKNDHYYVRTKECRLLHENRRNFLKAAVERHDAAHRELKMMEPVPETGLASVMVGAKVGGVSEWLAGLFNAAFEWLRKIINAIIEAVKKFFKDLADAFKWLWEKIKEAVRWVFDLIKRFFKWIWDQVTAFWKKFMDLLPKFDRFTISDIYIRCMVKPKGCDPFGAKRTPMMTFCFKTKDNSFCMGPDEAPWTLLLMPWWFIKNLWPLMKQFFYDLFGLEDKKFSVPWGFKWTSFGMLFGKPDKVKEEEDSFLGIKYDVPKDPEEADDDEDSAGGFKIPTAFKWEEWKFPWPKDPDDPDTIDENGNIKDSFTPKPEVIEQMEEIIEEQKEAVEDAKEHYEDAEDKMSEPWGKDESRQQRDKAKAQYEAEKDTLATVKRNLENYKAGKPKSYKANVDAKYAYKEGKGFSAKDFEKAEPSTLLLAPKYEGCGQGGYRKDAVPCHKAEGTQKHFYYFRKNGQPTAHMHINYRKLAAADTEFHESFKKRPSPSLPGHTIEQAAAKINRNHETWRHWVTGNAHKIAAMTESEIAVSDGPNIQKHEKTGKHIISSPEEPKKYVHKHPQTHVKYNAAWDDDEVQRKQKELFHMLHPKAVETGRHSLLHTAHVIHHSARNDTDSFQGPVHGPDQKHFGVNHFVKVAAAEKKHAKMTRTKVETFHKDFNKETNTHPATRTMTHHPTRHLAPRHPMQELEAIDVKKRKTWIHRTDGDGSKHVMTGTDLQPEELEASIDMKMGSSEEPIHNDIQRMFEDQEVTLFQDDNKPMWSRRDLGWNGEVLLAKEKNDVMVYNKTSRKMVPKSDYAESEVEDTLDMNQNEKEWSAYVSDGNFKGRGEKDVANLCRCDNGYSATPSSTPKCEKAGNQMCQKCKEGFVLKEKDVSGQGKAQLCMANECKCPNGTPTPTKDCAVDGELDCERCDDGYSLEEFKKDGNTKNKCIKNVCTCDGYPDGVRTQNGIPATGWDCVEHKANICTSCYECPGPKCMHSKNGYPLPWILTMEDQCEVRPCFRCHEECNQQMERNAWHLRIRFETTGLTLKIPDAIYNALGKLIPVKSVTMYSAEYSGLMEVTKENQKAAKNLAKMVEKIRNVTAKINQKASEVAATLAKMNGKEVEPPAEEGMGFDGILQTIGIPKEKTDKFLNNIGDKLGGLDIRKSLSSVHVDVNSTFINISGALLFKDKSYGFSIYARDYSDPTQEEKESLCQPWRKQLGVRLHAALGLQGHKETIFNTAKGDLDIKARYYHEKDWEFAGNYNGTGGLGFGEGEAAVNLALHTGKFEFESIPPTVSTGKQGRKHKMPGGLRLRVAGSGKVKLPMLPEVSINRLDFEYKKDAFPSGWAAAIDVDAPVAGGRIAATAMVMYNETWDSTPLLKLGMETRGETNLHLNRLPGLNKLPHKQYMPQILPGGKISVTIAPFNIPKNSSECPNDCGWRHVGANIYTVQFPRLNVVSEDRVWQGLVVANQFKLENAIGFIPGEVLGDITGGQDLKVQLDGAVTIKNWIPNTFKFKLLVKGGPLVTLPKGSTEDKAIMSFKGKGMLIEMLGGVDTGKFEIRFIGQAEAKMNGVGKVDGMLTGEYLLWDDGYTYVGTQTYVKGEAMNTKMECLYSAFSEQPAPIEQPDGKMQPQKKTTLFGAAIMFPDGVFLKNLPLFSKLPGIQFIPGLSPETYFSFSNKEGATTMLLDGIKTSVAKKGKLLDKEFAKGAAALEDALKNGPPQKVGLTLPPTTLNLKSALKGPLTPLNELLQKDTSITLAGSFDIRRGDIELEFSAKGGIKAGLEKVVKFDMGAISTYFELKLNDAKVDNEGNPMCGCKSNENCMSIGLDISCWKPKVSVGGHGGVTLFIADPPIHMKARAKGEFTLTDDGKPLISLEIHSRLSIWDANANMMFKMDPDPENLGNSSLVQVAFGLDRLDIFKLPGLRSIGVGAGKMVLDKGVVYVANHDATVGANEYKAGVTMAGVMNFNTKQKPEFAKKIQNFFRVDLEKAHISAWIPVQAMIDNAAEADFVMAAGAVGSLRLGVGPNVGISIIDPAFAIFRDGGSVYTTIKVHGKAEMGTMFTADFKDCQLFVRGVSSVLMKGEATTVIAKRKITVPFEFFTGVPVKDDKGEFSSQTPTSPRLLDGEAVTNELYKLFDEDESAKKPEMLLQFSSDDEWDKDEEEEPSVEFYSILGPVTTSATGTALDKLSDIEAKGITVTVSSKAGFPVSERVKKSIAVSKLSRGASLYIDVGVKEESPLGKLYKVFPFKYLPKKVLTVMNVDVAPGYAGFEIKTLLASSESETDTQFCWQFASLGPVGALAMCKLQISFKITTSEEDGANVSVGFVGQASLLNSLLGKRVNFPLISGRLQFGTGGFYLLLAGVAKFTLFPEDPVPLEFGKLTSVIQVGQKDGEDVGQFAPATFAIEMETSPKILVQLVNKIVQKIGGAAAKIVGKILDVLTALAGGIKKNILCN
jgi:hypothetical protein